MTERERHTEYMRRWRPLHRDTTNAQQNQRRVDNPAPFRTHIANVSAIKRGAAEVLSVEDVRYVIQRDQGRCVFCGVPTNNLDHDLPLSRGGLNDRHNIQLCCRPCNNRKRTMTSAEYCGEVIAYCDRGHPRERTVDRRTEPAPRWYCRTCRRVAYNPERAAEARICGAMDPSAEGSWGYVCTRRRGHKGDHIARGTTAAEGEYARWLK